MEGEWETTDEVGFVNFFHALKQGDLDEKTFGEYTGLKDKKRTKEFPEGQEIYEGDILEFDVEEWASAETNKFAVKWDKNYACFTGNGVVTEWREFCEAIGNIYDNPELLK